MLGGFVVTTMSLGDWVSRADCVSCVDCVGCDGCVAGCVGCIGCVGVIDEVWIDTSVGLVVSFSTFIVGISILSKKEKVHK